MSDVRLLLGDCREHLGKVESSSVDAVITDPPYPCIHRSYGYWTEEQWHEMMRAVVGECRRILKPNGSAVFILQPNSERVGRMRVWLWEFMAWAGREWGIVQDVWWWNITALPTAHCDRRHGLLRSSLKACVWLGPEDCYRDQDAVLWEESQETTSLRLSRRLRNGYQYMPSGLKVNKARMVEVALERGGVTPFNVLPIPNANSSDSAGSHGHGAGTPAVLANWWIRYICPPDGLVCDPFMGSGTMGIEALNLSRSFIGIEQNPDYFAIAERRIADARNSTPLFV